MDYCAIKSNNLTENANKIKDFIEANYKDKTLILNLTQENRYFEIQMGIEDLIIYNSYDYIKGLCKLDKSILYTDTMIDIIPSTIKKEKISLVIETFEDDLLKLVSEEDEDDYQNIIIIYSDPLQVEKMLHDIDYLNFDTNEDGLEDRKKVKLSFFGKVLNFFKVKKDE